MAFSDDAANDGCIGCMQAVDENGNSAGSPAVLNFFETSQGQFAVVNTAACESAAQGHAECGGAISDVVFCYQTACGECDDPDFQGCAEWSLGAEGICAQIPVPDGCEKVDLNVDSPECAGDDFASLFVSVGNYFCGPAGG